MKKILAIVLSVVLLCVLVACSASTAFQIVTVGTGDTLKISFKTDKHMWDMELENSMLTLSEDDKRIYECAFHTNETLTEYIEVVKAAKNFGTQDIKIESSGQVDNLKYVCISFTKEEKTVHEAIMWIVGSNTGLVADTHGDKSLADEILNALKFNVTKTEQSSDTYVCEALDSLKS